jgi:hypothetical protein
MAITASPHLRVLILLSVITLLSSCGSSGGRNKERFKEQLRVVHAAPSLGTLTLLQNGKPIVAGVTYATATQYVEIDESLEGIPDIFTVRINPDFVLSPIEVEELVNSDYKKTVILTEDSDGLPELTFIEDPRTEIPRGESRIRFLNGNLKESTADLFITAPSSSLTGRSADVAGLIFKEVSSRFAIEPGTYRIRVRSTGKTPSIILDTQEYPVGVGEELLFIFLEKRGGGTPYTYLSLTD